MKIGLGISVVENFILNAGGGGITTPLGLATIQGYYNANSEIYSDIGGTTPITGSLASENLGFWGDLSANANHLARAVASTRSWFRDGVNSGPNDPVTSIGTSEGGYDLYNLDAANVICMGATLNMRSGQSGLIMGRNEVTLTNGGWMLWSRDGLYEFTIFDSFGVTQLAVRSASAVEAESIATNIIVDYDGSKNASGVRMWIKGVAEVLTITQDTLAAGSGLSPAGRFGIGGDPPVGVAGRAKVSDAFIAAELLTQDIVDSFYAQSQIDFSY